MEREEKMATITVLSYSNSPATVINSNATKALIKNSNNNDLNKTNLNKRPYSTMAKKLKSLPLSEANANIINTISSTSNVLVSNTVTQSSAKLAKTLKRPLPVIDTTTLCRASGGKSKIFPLPVAVARRNARERNRVKQVNNGFAALRDRIPDEVASAFEAQGNGRGSVKKLSKVETLRMAVEYIRSLEKLLDLNTTDCSQTNISCNEFQLSNESYQLSDTSSVLSPPSENISSGSFDESDCFLPDITVIEGHQYVRIPGTNTYQLLENASDDTSIIYENDENIAPMILNSSNANQTLQHIILPQEQQQTSSPIDDYTAELVNDPINCYRNETYNNQIHILTPASISPGAYSIQSSTAGLSPAIHDINSTALSLNEKNTTEHFPTTTSVASVDVKDEISSLNLNNSALYSNSLIEQINPQYEGILTLKTKLKNDIVLSDDVPLSEESMLEAMNWWNSQQSGGDNIVNHS